MRDELNDFEWTAIKPMLPNKPRGVRRVTTVACSTASFGSCVQVHRGATCPRIMWTADYAMLTLRAGDFAARCRHSHHLPTADGQAAFSSQKSATTQQPSAPGSTLRHQIGK
jgi:transposase